MKYDITSLPIKEEHHEGLWFWDLFLYVFLVCAISFGLGCLLCLHHFNEQQEIIKAQVARGVLTMNGETYILVPKKDYSVWDGGGTTENF